MIKISLNFVPKDPINKIPALHGSDNGLAPVRRQAIIWTNDVYWCIYALLSLSNNE